jgi:hypothetical protein
MNFVSTIPTLAWLGLAAVPVGIILLYFLKLRRNPMTVPSTFLWERTIEDLHVNSLIQRLRSNLLLFLQLLFVALAAIALLRPGWQGESGPARRLIFLLDASASMAATDVQEAETRFDLAKAKLLEQIDAMRGDDVAMVIAFSDRSDIVQEFTSDRRRLKDAIGSTRVSARPTNMLEALRAAAGLANPNRTSQAGDVNDVQVADALPAELYVYSDGGFGPVTDFNLGNLTPTYVAIGTASAANLSILTFNAERNLERPEQVQAFASVANLGTRAIACTASLYLDQELIEAEAIDLEPGDETGLSFQLDAVDGNELKLVLETEDDLEIDNTAYAALTPIRNVSVLLVTPGNRALELALETEQASKLGTIETRLPDYLQSDAYKARAAEGTDDLIIFDRCAPDAMPPVNTMFVGALPPELWTAGELTGPVIPIDIDRTQPIMRYLELFSLRIVEGRSLEGPRGSSTLISADIGPVLVLGPRGGFQDLVMGFEIFSEGESGPSFNTDWPVQRSWPVFIYNVMRFLGGAIDTSSATTVRPGDTVMIRVDNRLRNVRVDSPDRPDQEIAVGPAGNIPYPTTDAPGIYRVFVDNSERPINLFTVNLFDSRESNLDVAPEIELGYEAVESTVANVPRRSELWRWMLAAALAILALEWLLFNRRLI